MSAWWIVPVVPLLAAFVLVLMTARAKRRIEQLVPPQGRFVDVPGARLHVVEKGEGPTILMIHGLAGQLCHFTYGMVDRLAATHRVVAVDRPGSGYSTRPDDAPASLFAQADVMAALIDALGLGRPVVVGHSLGGAVSLALAQRHPQRVAALALIAPLTLPPKGVSSAFAGLQIGQPWLRRLVAWTVMLPLAIATRDKVLGIVFGPEAIPADAATRGGGLLAVRPSHFIAASTDLAAIPADFEALVKGYPRMALPVEVLYGRGDRILKAQEQGGGLAAVLPGARLTLVDGGHMLPVTQPQVAADFVQAVAARA